MSVVIDYLHEHVCTILYVLWGGACWKIMASSAQRNLKILINVKAKQEHVHDAI